MRSPYISAAVLAVTVVMHSASPSAAQLPQAATEEAQRSIAVLQRLASERGYQGLGFESLEEVKSATLGAPLQVFMVGLDALRDYQSQTDPNSLLIDEHRLIYPVVVGGQQRSSITMQELEGKWEIASIGRPRLANAIALTRQGVIKSTNAPIESTFGVEVPALNLFFIGYRADGKLSLTPVFGDPSLKIEEGQSMEAHTVFGALAPAARELKTGPDLDE